MTRLGAQIREGIQRGVLVVLGLVAGLVLLEVVLQLGARYHAAGGVGSRWSTGGRRILTVGDSNTYGLYVDPGQAYPKVFERLWNATHPTDPIEVMNLGYPGMNSSKLRRALPRMLTTFRPDLVTVMVGVNDLWTVPEPVGDERPTLTDHLWRYSRVYRLLFMIRRSLAAPTLSLVPEKLDRLEGHGIARYGHEALDLDYRAVGPDTVLSPSRPDLEANLQAMISIARRAGSTLVLVTYPAENGVYYAGPNRVMRQVAVRSGAPLVDVGPSFLPDCAQGPCAELFPDAHPTAKGHLLAAKILVHALDRARRNDGRKRKVTSCVPGDSATARNT